MPDQSKPVVSRRVAYSAAAVLGTAILIPAVPAIASSFSSGGSGVGGSQVVTLEVVDPGTHPTQGQISQAPEGQTMFISCPAGRILGGGYELPDGATNPMVVSAPSLDSRRWNFRSAGVVPVGTKYYAICSTA